MDGMGGKRAVDCANSPGHKVNIGPSWKYVAHGRTYVGAIHISRHLIRPALGARLVTLVSRCICSAWFIMGAGHTFEPSFLC